ncbi:MAG: hypothetical protein Q4E22_06285, partial [Coriobacteriia bacterium]|nr:hypothetical protein [Coriobacteriia bacterium]
INTTNNNNTTNQPALSIDYFDAQRDGLTNSNSYHEYTVDISDYQIAALLRTAVPIKHLSVFYFEVEDVSNDGVPVGQVFGGYYLEELTPDKPLVLHTTIQGTFPTVAVGYYDKDEYVTYGIIMNGMDGSLELTPVIIK